MNQSEGELGAGVYLYFKKKFIKSHSQKTPQKKQKNKNAQFDTYKRTSYSSEV